MVDPEPFKLPIGTALNGMSRTQYTINRELRSGKHGSSYVASADPGEHAVFLKTPFIDLKQPLETQNEKAVTVYNSFINEYRNRERLSDVKGVAHILDAGIYEYDNRLVTFLVQELVSGIPLEEYLQAKYGRPPRDFCGIPFQRDWIDLAKKIVEIVRRIHNRFVVHGDIWPANVLMVESEPVLVDFGQSFLVDEMFHEVGGQIAAHPYLAPERASPETTWDMPADIYSVGALMFYLATGRPPPPPLQDVEELKKIIHAGIRDRNPHLLRENVGIVKIIDKSLRYDVVDRYPYINDVLDAIDIFDYSPEETFRKEPKAALDEVLDELRGTLHTLSSSSTTLFAELAVSELLSLRRAVDGMLRGHHEVTAEREELINSLLRYLRVLDPGDEYLTVTVPGFWSENNLGVNGRFLTMNQMMALKGVVIRRVFLLCENDRDDSTTRRILEAHLRSTEELEGDGVVTKDKALPAVDAKSYWTGFLPVTERQRAAMMSRQHVAIWRKPATDELVSITFSQRPGTGQIGKVRFWASPLLKPVVEEFRERIAESRHLSEYLLRG